MMFRRRKRLLKSKAKLMNTNPQMRKRHEETLTSELERLRTSRKFRNRRKLLKMPNNNQTSSGT